MKLDDALAVAALLGIGVGCWWISPAWGLIVPCAIVFGCQAIARLKGASDVTSTVVRREAD